MVDQETGSRDIALCLSGGGLRATLFHLGVIKALRTHRRGEATALSQIGSIYSVSGGSITAAHLVRYWTDYNGDNDAFAKREGELLAFSRRNVRDRVLRRWALTRWLGFRRSWWLQHEYQALVGPGAIADCYAASVLDDRKGPPDLHILATSFSTGALCSFGPRDFELMGRHGAQAARAPGGHLKLAYAVAASSAFPPLFPPVPLTRKTLGDPDPADFLHTIHLADGGVFDNLGAEAALADQIGSNRNFNTLLVSNAGAALHLDPGKSFVNFLARNVRASDILMRRIAEDTERRLRAMTNATYLPLRIGIPVPGSALLDVTQTRLRMVRTDLDRFDPALANLLIWHGYEVASQVLKEQGWQETQTPESALLPAGRINLPAIAEKGAETRKRSLLFDFRDWLTVPILWAMIAGAIFAIAMGIQGIRERNAANLAEREAKVEADKRMRISQALADQLGPIRSAYIANDRKRLGELIGMTTVAVEVAENQPDRDLTTDPIRLSSSQALAVANQPVAYNVPRPFIEHKQPVYIQFAGFQRAQIAALNRGLRNAGWTVQGQSGERLSKAAGLNEVRWSGSNEQAAIDLKDAINAANLTSKPLRIRQADVGATNLEVWISR